MTNPPQGPYQGGPDPAQWARPVPPTERIPQQGGPVGPTERIPHQMPPAGPTERIAAQPPTAEPPTQHIPRAAEPTAYPQPQSYPAAESYPAPESYPAAESAVSGGRLGRFLRDPLSVVLVLVTVAALGLAALVGGELYARSRANSVVSKVVECVVKDNASASFGMVPPFLWQHANKHYTNIDIETAGNRVLDAQGMKLNIDIKDVRLQNTATSAGTIGSLVATVNWSTDGIKSTVQDAIPLFGGIVSGVTTNAAAGTVELQGPLGTVTAKPKVTDGDLALEVLGVTGLGFTLPSESVQPALDVFTSHLTKDLPLGIKADSVQVTDSGVVSQFSTQNATMPPATEDACFGGL